MIALTRASASFSSSGGFGRDEGSGSRRLRGCGGGGILGFEFAWHCFPLPVRCARYPDLTLPDTVSQRTEAGGRYQRIVCITASLWLPPTRLGAGATSPQNDSTPFSLRLPNGIVTALKACGVLDGRVARADEEDQLQRVSLPAQRLAVRSGPDPGPAGASSDGSR